MIWCTRIIANAIPKAKSRCIYCRYFLNAPAMTITKRASLESLVYKGKKNRKTSMFLVFTRRAASDAHFGLGLRDWSEPRL